MENFKLDLSKLTPVDEKDRVKGNWYVVADSSNGSKIGAIIQYHSSSRGMDLNGEQSWSDWKHWFASPPNLPGFPDATLPDQIRLPLSEWAYSYNQDVIVLHRKKYVPTLVIPACTIEERKRRLQEELDKLDRL